jgi:hypothetical protein
VTSSARPRVDVILDGLARQLMGAER